MQEDEKDQVELYHPTAEDRRWVASALANLREGSRFTWPGSDPIYQISHADKTVIRLHRGRESDNSFLRGKAVWQAFGYTLKDQSLPVETFCFGLGWYEVPPRAVASVDNNDLARELAHLAAHLASCGIELDEEVLGLTSDPFTTKRWLVAKEGQDLAGCREAALEWADDFAYAVDIYLPKENLGHG